RVQTCSLPIIHNHFVKQHFLSNRWHPGIEFAAFWKLTIHPILPLLNQKLDHSNGSSHPNQLALIIHYAVNQRHLDTANYFCKPDTNLSSAGKADGEPYPLGN